FVGFANYHVEPASEQNSHRGDDGNPVEVPWILWCARPTDIDDCDQPPDKCDYIDDQTPSAELEFTRRFPTFQTCTKSGKNDHLEAKINANGTERNNCD